MNARQEFPIGWRSGPLVFRSQGKSREHRVQIDLKKENAIEQIDEAVKIPGTAAKERYAVTLIGHQTSNLIDVPDAMLVGEAIQGLTGYWIALISQLIVTMDDMVAASPLGRRSPTWGERSPGGGALARRARPSDGIL